jgi:hypothetical protein
VQVKQPARILALGLVLVLLADAASQNVLYFTTQNGNRENYKDAYAQVQASRQPEDWVVTTRPEIAEYYMGIQPVDSNRIDLDGIIASGRPAWFVMDNRTHVSTELAGLVRGKRGDGRRARRAHPRTPDGDARPVLPGDGEG